MSDIFVTQAQSYSLLILSSEWLQKFVLSKNLSYSINLLLIRNFHRSRIPFGKRFRFDMGQWFSIRLRIPVKFYSCVRACRGDRQKFLSTFKQFD